jgi:hypothetical protein
VFSTKHSPGRRVFKRKVQFKHNLSFEKIILAVVRRWLVRDKEESE